VSVIYKIVKSNIHENKEKSLGVIVRGGRVIPKSKNAVFLY